jgi:hypothetical protein
MHTYFHTHTHKVHILFERMLHADEIGHASSILNYDTDSQLAGHGYINTDGETAGAKVGQFVQQPHFTSKQSTSNTLKVN